MGIRYGQSDDWHRWGCDLKIAPSKLHFFRPYSGTGRLTPEWYTSIVLEFAKSIHRAAAPDLQIRAHLGGNLQIPPGVHANLKIGARWGCDLKIAPGDLRYFRPLCKNRS